MTLTACRLPEQEPLLNGDLKFSGDEFVFVANDRLLAPNNDATYKALHDELETVAQCLYANADIEIQHRSEDPRERFSVLIKSSPPSTSNHFWQTCTVGPIELTIDDSDQHRRADSILKYVEAAGLFIFQAPVRTRRVFREVVQRHRR